jgi:RND family efflux transporter MFP subunit
MSRGFISVLIVVLLFAPGCSKRQEKAPPAPPVKVGAMTVDKGPITIWLQVSGIMKFAANTTLSAEVSAQIESIEVEDGRFVEQGQFLMKLDDGKIKELAGQAAANLKKDEASLTFNRSELEKNKGLFESHSVSHSVYDQKVTAYQNTMAQVEADRALLARAMEDLKKTRVTAPISGVLSRRFAEKGDWVSEGKRLFQISDYRRIYLEAFVSDLDVGKISVKKIRSSGEDAEVRLDAYPGEIFAGRLTYVEAVASDNRLFEIRIYVENPEMSLLQGMVGRGSIVVKTISEVVRVPVQALLQQPRANADNSVYVVDDEKRARLAQIKIGEGNQNYTSVLGGLKESDVVIVQGKEVLSSGQPLAVTMLLNP